MTSQLNVDTIVDKAGTGGTNIKVGNDATYISDAGDSQSDYKVVESLVKSWGQIGGASATIGDSINISSADDNGTGQYDGNFTNPFVNADYGVGATNNQRGVGETGTVASYVNLLVRNNTDNNLTDADAMFVIAGELA